jgi:hypothetical protein
MRWARIETWHVYPSRRCAHPKRQSWPYVCWRLRSRVACSTAYPGWCCRSAEVRPKVIAPLSRSATQRQSTEKRKDGRERRILEQEEFHARHFRCWSGRAGRLRCSARSHGWAKIAVQRVHPKEGVGRNEAKRDMRNSSPPASASQSSPTRHV